MTTFTKLFLSGSTSGKGIILSQTATTGNTIHTAVSGSTSMDEIWIYVTNNHTAIVTLTIEFGEAASSPTTNTVLSVPPKSGRILAIDGRLLNNSLLVTAFASVTNVLTIDGFVNRIT